MPLRLRLAIVPAIVGIIWSTVSVASAQLAPEIGYLHPAGARAGSTIELTIGGYDWSPDTQLFPHDSRIRFELLGPPSPVLVPEPPYWFGAKGRGPAWPLPREFKARLTIPADVRPGVHLLQVANANGPSPVGKFHVSTCDELREEPAGPQPQPLSVLPVVVSGQIRKIEEIDRYEIRSPRTGPVTIELFARRLGSPLHALLSVRDSQGRLVLDAADTVGRDLCETFIARENEAYVISLHDADFAGDRSYVYRLQVTPGPRATAAYPSGGAAGETRKVAFTGIGLSTGADRPETVERDVTFPADAIDGRFELALDTPAGRTPPIELAVDRVSAAPLIEPAGVHETALPAGPVRATGAIEARFGVDTYLATWKKDEKWTVSAQSHSRPPLDLELTVLGPDGKELASMDDLPGSTDAAVAVTAPADGTYRILVADRSGASGSRLANYRLSVLPPTEEFSVSQPAALPITLGAPAKLAVKLVREGGFAGPVRLAVNGLPTGVTATTTDLTIPAGKSDLTIDLACAADVAVTASLVRLTATADLAGKPVERSAAPCLAAIVMKPRIKITPEGLDDVRKVNRGSTFLAPLLIERLEGYVGPITLEMTSKQQRHRQGLSSDEMVAPADATRVEYPIFVPEWMETTKTSRMIMNGVVQVPDPKGNLRTLVQRMELRVGILPQGALMKLSRTGDEPLTIKAGETLTLPMQLVRAAEFREPARIELVLEPHQASLFEAPATVVAGEVRDFSLPLKVAPTVQGDASLKIRATALQDGKWKVMSEAAIDLRVSP